MPIKHFYNQTVADGTATSVVRPSDWNSNHSMIYNLSGNTAGSSQLAGADITFVGGNNVTLSADTAASKLVFSAAAGGGAAQTRVFFDNLGPLATASGAMGAKAVQFRTVWFAPLEPFNGKFDDAMTANTVAIDMSITGSTATMSQTFVSRVSIGIYTLISTAGTLSMSLLNSASASFGYAVAATNNSTGFVAQRYLTIHSSQWSAQPSFDDGGRYIMGMVWDSSGAVSNQTNSILGGYMLSTAARSGYMGTNIAAATWQGGGQFLGHYSATSTALPTAVNYTQVNKQVASANFIPHLIFFNYTNLTL